MPRRVTRPFPSPPALFACLALASVLSAGVQFPARPGEAVVANEYLVRLKPGVAAELISSYLPSAEIRALHALNLHRIKVPNDPSAQAALSSLAADAMVEYVEPNHIRHLTLGPPNDTYYNSSQWDLFNIQAFQAWNVVANAYLTAATANPARITAAVIDTGVDCTHPDFANAGGTSADSAFGGQILFSGSVAFYQTVISPAVCPWQDDHGHGTHTAGTLAAATNNGGGVASLGYPLQLIVYKGLAADGTGADSLLADTIMQAADTGVRVISASWGDGFYSQALQDAVTYAWQRNTLFVAAAGNGGTSSLFFPAGATFAAGVAATDSNNNRAGFSDDGDYVRIAAPGVNTFSTVPTYVNTLGLTGYADLSGTSMATPHVAALAGLLWIETPNASAAAVLQRIQQTASSSNANGGWTGDVGYGIINAYGAVNDTLRPSSVGGLTGQVTDIAGNLIAAQLTATGPITAATIADVNGRYRFANLPAGTYQLTISASGHSPLILSATIAPGADTILPAKMGASYGKFTGTVTSSGSPVGGAIVQALSSGLIESTAVAGSNGVYTLWVVPGTYDIAASTLSSNPGIVTGQSVAANGSTTVNVSLTKPENAVPVTVMTNPAGLNVVVDGVTYAAPHFFTWAHGSSHTLNTSTVQASATTHGTFHSWSNGGNQSQTVTITGPSSYTANFTAQFLLTTGAGPGGEGSISPSSGFYDAGTPVTITAHPSSGYMFTGFTGDLGGATNPQVLTMSAPHTVMANFSPPLVTVTTSPPGLNVIVDGQTYLTPRSFAWTQGSTHTLNAFPGQGSGGTQFVFTAWNNTASQAQTVTMNGTTTYTANYKTQYQLTTAVSPGAGGGVSPAAGFYDAGTVLAITATPAGGYSFSGFTGDLSGTTNPQLLTMGSPHTVTANFTINASGDLALGKLAAESSTLAGYGSATSASSAVDGNTDGNFFDGSVTHTNQEANAWWQVDLGAPASIASIAIWNRTDCCGDRLGDYWVFVSNVPFGAGDTPTTLVGRAGTWSSHQTSAPNPSVTIPVNAQGRYVRVQISGTNFLSLAEVRVFPSNANATTSGISGQVTLSGAGLGGVSVSLSGSEKGSATTSSAGSFSFTGLPAGNYTVTPSLAGYSFTPPSVTLNNLSGNQTANFIASAVPASGDLALGRPASQSSTLSGYGSSAAASSAVDGNTDGDFFDGSVTHTNADANAWWQVDLGASSSIGSLVIWNRTDCCGSRLSDYWVFVSNTPFLATDTPATLMNRAGTWSSHETAMPNPSASITVNAAGRYVRVQLSGANNLSLAEVQVFGGAVTGNTNLALSKSASQSSTLAGYNSTPPSSAVDGNTDGNFFDGSVTHTNSDANAWWQVDLGASASISSIAIWNRTDCCGNRLSDYWVFVSNTPFLATDTPATLASRAGTWSSHQTSMPNPSATIAANAQGRYVRVQLSGSNFLSLAEVQVFGSFASGTGNLALSKNASQSSTLAGFGPSPAASSAVDGNTDGSFFDGSVTHTNVDANAWWQVDLGTSAAIGSITIWNRMDCCSDRLSDYWVFVSNTPFLPTDTPATLQNRAGTWSSHQTAMPNPSSPITVNTQARYVRVQLSGTNNLSLAEVQVFGQ